MTMSLLENPMRPLLSLLALPALVAQVPAPLAFLSQARTASLVVVAPRDHALARNARRALRTSELAPLELSYRGLDPGRKEDLERATALRALVALPAAGWALISPSGAVLASGGEPPVPSALVDALSRAGIQSPIQKVKAFLRTHPDHLEARQTLIRLLRKGAVARTRKLLEIEAKSLQERSQDGELQGYALNHTDVPDMSSYRTKRLEPLQDLETWGAYAQEVDRVFTDGTWPSLDLGMRPDTDLPVEVCSPTMQALYLRHLPKVETLLAALPGTDNLWGMWLRLTAISGKQPGRAFAAGLPVPPPELGIEWPPSAVVEALVKDAQARGDWSIVRDLLDSFWKDAKEATTHARERLRHPGEKERIGTLPNWDTGYGPLLEAMLRMGSEGEAQELVEGLALDPEKRSLVDRAIALAITCQKPTLARRWATLGR